MEDICRDLRDEYDDLYTIVAHLPDAVWQTVTPFSGWTIKDQITHLSYFDRAAFLSITDEKAFESDTLKLIDGVTDYDEIHQRVLDTTRDMSIADLLSTWRQEQLRLLQAYSELEPDHRLPWYSRSMTARSSASARIMEVWAHGQDIIETLKLPRSATRRLRHIARIGISTFKWSFENRSMEVPKEPIRVELTGPEDERWEWGPENADEFIKGPAEDFCMVVTQRRHPSDVALDIQGENATVWMSIAQAFAGPPEQGPEAGQRS